MAKSIVVNISGEIIIIGDRSLMDSQLNYSIAANPFAPPEWIFKSDLFPILAYH